MSTTRTDLRIRPENELAAGVWNAGGARYERITRQIADAIEHCVDRLDPRPGQRILDVATGTGLAARRARARGAEVIGTDFAADVIAAARELDPGGDFRVADAEALPFDDAEFDGVTSTFGVMFCMNPERAAAELARVTRPGGRVALATWQETGGVFDMFTVIQKYAPKPTAPKPSPFAWGRRARIEELLGDHFDLGFEDAVSYYREADGEAAWDAFSTGYGPTKTLVASLDPETAGAFREDFVAYHERHRTGAGILVPRPYLITLARRKH